MRDGMMRDAGRGQVVADGEYKTVTRGEAKEVPPYMGIGAEIKVMVVGDKLFVDAHEPGFRVHWVGRIARITELEKELAYWKSVVEDPGIY